MVAFYPDSSGVPGANDLTRPDGQPYWLVSMGRTAALAGRALTPVLTRPAATCRRDPSFAVAPPSPRRRRSHHRSPRRQGESGRIHRQAHRAT